MQKVKRETGMDQFAAKNMVEHLHLGGS